MKISDASMRMLQDEALEVFQSFTKGMGFELRTQQINYAVQRAVGYALNCALEEGIVEIPNNDLKDAAQKAVEAWERFIDPNIRVGPVHRTMRELEEALGDNQ